MKDFYRGEKKPNRYCGGKRIYDKKGALTAKNKRWREDRVLLRIYECDYSHWHLTSQIEKKKKKRNHKKKFSRKLFKYKKNYED